MSCLLHFIFFLLLPLASTGCPNRCGNVLIPYPFGVGSGCFLEASFNVTCNTSTTPPKPYLNIINLKIEVVEIRVDNPAYIRIKYPYLLYGVCYHTSSGNMTWTDGWGISLWDTQYTLSEYNWLIAIGCDDALTASIYKGQGNQTFR
ncbi:wall-associated receptor kinase-like 10 [Salvia miltiorrhiza]|uniref:wall-associated receptor kinase-like 10 n=1 Tax=Salvia miltiorrhiza TaxID=226208 RepID=UPI0025AB6AEA|nr:wall-associated receptor kinase-like 10 [Salvia miltiorrhiza]